MTPRDYQLYAIQCLFDYFLNKSGNPLIAMPTGTGKSVVIALFVRLVLSRWPQQRILMLTHVEELIRQNFAKLLEAWPTAPAGIYSAALKQRDTGLPIIFGGVASVVRRISAFGRIDLLLIDEAHLVSPSEKTMYRTIIKALLIANPHLKVIGLTATAFRLGQGKLIEEGGIFTDICCDMTSLEPFNWFINQGYLCPLIPKSTSTILGTDGVHMQGGEFVANELQNAVDKKPLTEAAVREMMEMAQYRRSWLIFCTGIDHTEHVAEMLNGFGVDAVAVHSKMKGSSAATIKQWKAYELRVIVNNNMMTTGIDHPGLDFIGCMRPTASPGLWVQMLGRGTRPLYVNGFDLSSLEGRLASIAASPKQNCLVADFARNTKRLGPINDPYIPGKKGKGGGEAPVKLCENCNTYNHASVRVCSNCGHPFPDPLLRIRPEASTEALIKPDLPIVEVLQVDHVTYSMHVKKSTQTASLKINYYCGLRNFSEHVNFDHPQSWVASRAQKWWLDHVDPDKSTSPPPTTTVDALSRTTELKVPGKVHVWTNKQYPQIMNYVYDDSRPKANTYITRAAPTVNDDDIPF